MTALAADARTTTRWTCLSGALSATARLRAELLPYRSADEGDSADAFDLAPRVPDPQGHARRLEMLLHEVSPTALRAA